MTYSESQLADVTEYAGLFFAANEIALILDVPLVEFQKHIANPDSEVHRAYLRGKLLATASIRKTVKTMAIAGSSPAFAIVNKMMEEQDRSEEKIKQLYGKTD